MTTAAAPIAATFDASTTSATAREVTPNHCPTCDTFLQGRFCHACGELAPEGRNTTLTAFAHQAFHEVLDVDSKTVTTFRALFRRPGLLTVEYMAGRTKRYLSPLKLYVTVFAAMMFAYSIWAPMRVYDVERSMGLAAHPEAAAALAKMLARPLARNHLTLHDFFARWSALFEAYANWTQLLNVAVTALILAALYRRSRRPMLEHTVLAFHILAFNFCVSILLWPAYYAVGLQVGPGYYAVVAVAFLTYTPYAYFALRRVYGQSRRRTAVKTALFLGACQAGLGVVAIAGMLVSLVHTLLTLR